MRPDIRVIFHPLTTWPGKAHRKRLYVFQVDNNHDRANLSVFQDRLRQLQLSLQLVRHPSRMQTPILCQKLQLHPHVQLCRPRRRTQLERKTSVLHIISIIMSLNFVGIGQQEAGIVPFGVDFKNPNFAKVAEAMGAKGIRLEEAGDVKDAPRR